MARYTVLKDKLKEGQWLFTCSMQPLQFSHLDKPKDLKYYDESWQNESEEKRQDFINDDFVTIGGSHHSFQNCSCTLISEKYALWFIENKCWELYEVFKSKDDVWDLYEMAVKNLAQAEGLEYEGI